MILTKHLSINDKRVFVCVWVHDLLVRFDSPSSAMICVMLSQQQRRVGAVGVRPALPPGEIFVSPTFVGFLMISQLGPADSKKNWDANVKLAPGMRCQMRS